MERQLLSETKSLQQVSKDARAVDVQIRFMELDVGTDKDYYPVIGY